MAAEAINWEEIYVIIPAFDEETKIGEVIDSVRQQGGKNIIVVDDGSKDQTFAQSQAKNIEVLKHAINRGQGAALKTGIDYALEQGAKIIVTFDSDGQHQAEELPTLILPIQQGQAEVVLGSRFLNDNSNVPLARKIFLKGGSLIFRLMYGIKLTDSHNGLRAFSRDAARKINFTQDRMEHASEIVEEISRKKIKYLEVPVTIKYTDYSLQHGQKNSNAFKILFKMLFNKLVR